MPGRATGQPSDLSLCDRAHRLRRLRPRGPLSPRPARREIRRRRRARHAAWIPRRRLQALGPFPSLSLSLPRALPRPRAAASAARYARNEAHGGDGRKDLNIAAALDVRPSSTLGGPHPDLSPVDPGEASDQLNQYICTKYLVLPIFFG